MRFPFRSLAAATVLVAMGAGVGWVLFGSELLQYRVVRIVGNERAGEAQIRHLADLPVGEPLAGLDLPRAVAGVERHPWVKRAEARRAFPDTVVIRVEERVAVAVLQLGAELFLVDAEGEPFTRALAGELDRPYLTGLDPAFASAEPALAGRIVRDAIGVLDAAQARGGLAESDISQIHFDARAGYTLALCNGGEVLLGFRDTEMLERLASLRTNGLDLSRPHRVDLGSPQLAVVTPL